ncbi:MAG: hypothetical protein HY278_03635 [candidate division NC10 bacterium]|nr:hypothetical protein [candidate division NC10 bacterium]
MTITLAAVLLPGAALGANKDLVIVKSERWIDTIKGTVKNVSADRAEEVVIVIRFYGQPGTSTPVRRPRSTRHQEVGQQTVRLATLEPGQEAPFEVEIAEKHRKATSFKFEPHAIWRKGSSARPHRH